MGSRSVSTFGATSVLEREAKAIKLKRRRPQIVRDGAFRQMSRTSFVHRSN